MLTLLTQLIQIYDARNQAPQSCITGADQALLCVRLLYICYKLDQTVNTSFRGASSVPCRVTHSSAIPFDKVSNSQLAGRSKFQRALEQFAALLRHTNTHFYYHLIIPLDKSYFLNYTITTTNKNINAELHATLLIPLTI